MVSLKKEPQIREFTPVHLMDEDEAIRTYCPPRENVDMVSLKKEPHIREFTPVHLMDEDEAIRTYCPPRENVENEIKKSVKQADNEILPAVKNNDNDNDKLQECTLGGLNKWEWAEIMVKSILIIGALAFLVFFVGSYLAEGLTLVKDLAT